MLLRLRDPAQSALEAVWRQRVEVLPFHQMREDKWDRLSIPYPLHGVHPPENDVLNRVRGQFEARGLTVF